MKLTPFVPLLHTHKYGTEVTAQSHSHCWYLLLPSSFNQILTELKSNLARNSTWILLTIIDKANDDAMEGVIGLLEHRRRT